MTTEAQSTSTPSALEDVLLQLSQELGRPATLPLLRSALPKGVEQANVEHLLDLCTVAGLHCRPLPTQKVAQIEDQEFPVLVAAPDGRPVIILRVEEDNSAVLIEPGLSLPQTRPLIEEPFYHSDCQLFSVPIKSQRLAERWAWFLVPVFENKPIYVQAMIAAVLTNILALSSSIFIMTVYDRVLPNNATESLVALTIGVAIAMVFDLIVKNLRSWFLDGAGARADQKVGQRLFEQLLAMDMSAKRESVGGLSFIMREFEVVREFLTSATLVALIDLPFVFFFIFVIFLIGGPVAWVPLTLVPLVLLVGLLAQPFLAKLSADGLAEGKNKQSVLVESISGLETLKTSAAGREMRKRWREALVRQSDMSIKTRLLSQIVINFSAFAQQVAQVGIVVIGAFLVADNRATMGSLIASVIIAGRVLSPLSQIASLMTKLVQVRTALKALDQFMQMPLDRPPATTWIRREKIEGSIEFRNVEFAYPSRPNKVLDNVSFKIAAGERVAILGRIGSGKSTISRLVLGLYHPQTGSVLIDGAEVRQIDPFDLRRHMSIVQQDTWLFSGSVRENIAVGAERPTDEEILLAGQKAGVSDFLADHPNGYDLQLAERGEGLSGGQRQAICVARALVGNPSVLIMDEPTSSMDTPSEAALVAKLKASTQGKTLIIITHRTAVLDLVDRVIVMDKGKVVADGPKSILSGNKAQPAAAPPAPPSAPTAPPANGGTQT